jgi:hypothetical protein
MTILRVFERLGTLIIISIGISLSLWSHGMIDEVIFWEPIDGFSNKGGNLG